MPMSNSAIPILPSPIASFAADDSATVVGPRGEVAHRDHLAHSERLAELYPKLQAVHDGREEREELIRVRKKHEHTWLEDDALDQLPMPWKSGKVAAQRIK